MNLQKHISRVVGPEIAYLPVFSGRNYRHRLYDNYRYTDLVREKLCERGAFWLIERIFALQELLSAHDSDRIIQFWDVITLSDGSVQLFCREKRTGEVMYYEHIDIPASDCGDLAFTLQRKILQIRSA